jgi:hypothetical protein
MFNNAQTEKGTFEYRITSQAKTEVAKKMNTLLEVRALYDEPKFLETCVDLLMTLQRNQGKVAESLTVLKYEKPALHSLLRKRLMYNPGLLMLMDLSLDYQQAKASLESQ